MEERRSQRRTAGKQRHGMEREAVNKMGSIQTPVRSLTGKQQPQLCGLPSVLLLVLPQVMGLERQKCPPGKGKAAGAPRSSAVGTLPRGAGMERCPREGTAPRSHGVFMRTCKRRAFSLLSEAAAGSAAYQKISKPTNP